LIEVICGAFLLQKREFFGAPGDIARKSVTWSAPPSPAMAAEAMTSSRESTIAGETADDGPARDE
jgi:hypothetical protein